MSARPRQATARKAERLLVPKKYGPWTVEFGFWLTSAIGLCRPVFWVGSCAGCALVEWATNGSLESFFRGLSNGARG
eukprot:scaffold36031_cov152-Isochrysis_galbana.AAC.5